MRWYINVDDAIFNFGCKQLHTQRREAHNVYFKWCSVPIPKTAYPIQLRAAISLLHRLNLLHIAQHSISFSFKWAPLPFRCDRCEARVSHFGHFSVELWASIWHSAAVWLSFTRGTIVIHAAGGRLNQRLPFHRIKMIIIFAAVMHTKFRCATFLICCRVDHPHMTDWNRYLSQLHGGCESHNIEHPI